MGGLNFTISTWVIVIAVILTSISAFDFIRVMRYARAETKVYNGLEKLRKQLYWLCLTLLTINTIGMTVLIVRPLANPAINAIITTVVAIVVRLGFNVVAKLLLKIYTQQYTPQQKEFHKSIAKLETKREKRDARREVARVKLNKDRREETVKRNK